MARLVPRSGHCELDGMPLDIGIGSYGQTLIRCPGCERRRARRCMECGRPVVGKAWRCPAHARARRVALLRRSERRHHEERLKASRRRWKRLPREKREVKLAAKKAWRAAHPERVQAWKAKGAADGTFGYVTREKYLAAQAQQNAKRAERKREQMRELARLRSPWRDKEPSCLECQAVIPWNRLGRPRLRCVECQPPRVAA